MTQEFKHALDAAKYLCSKSEKCGQDVIKYLIKYNLSTDERNEIIVQLKKDGFINETRFASAFAIDKFRFNKWGRIKIRYELMRKNISDSTIDDALEQINETEYEKTILSLIGQKKIDAKNNYEYRQKMLKYLYGKGFEPEVAEKSIR